MNAICQTDVAVDQNLDQAVSPRPLAIKLVWQRTCREAKGRNLAAAARATIPPLERTKALLVELSHNPGVKPEWQAPSQSEPAPTIPLAFVKAGVRLNYFSMITTVGTPQTVTAEELRLESMFPADDATEAAHSRFVQANSGTRSSRN
jgi:MmyB-like transcription regulator ligand binding domain